MKIELTIKFNEKQRLVWDEFYMGNDYDHAFMNGGVRAGKTQLGHICAITEAQKNPGVDVIVVRSTHDEAVTINADHMFKMFKVPEQRRYLEERFNKKEGVLTLDNGSRIIFWGLGKPGEDRDIFEKVESAGFSFAFIDDARRIPQKVFLYLITRMSGKGTGKILLASNSPPKGSWLQEEFDQTKYKRRKEYRFDTMDNSENLPEGYIRQLNDMPDNWKKLYMTGDYGEILEGEGVFADEFDYEYHISERFDYVDTLVVNRLVGGIDFGWVTPAAVVLKQNVNKTVDCFYNKVGHSISIIEFFDDMRQELARLFCLGIKDIYWRGDIAGKQPDRLGNDDFTLLRKNFGIVVSGRKISLNTSIFSLKNALSLVRGGRPLFGVHPRCSDVIDGFLGGYRINHLGSIIKDKNYKHVMDALRYAWDEFGTTSAPYRPTALDMLREERKTHIPEPTYYRERRI